ncbi:ABC transporter permease [Solibacillus sp. CAU 1738]|uniref:ABC transporter permease n=1 Tax=Solibacillus sp. CAU 1738 TaxID=3140363 RepID=UPI00326076CE
MFFALIQKQLKILFRSPQEWLVLLLMPIALITIIGFALGSLMEGSTEAFKVNIAIVQHEDEQQEFAAFLQEASEIIGMDEQVQKSLTQMMPISKLKELLFENEEMKQFMNVTNIDPKDIEKAHSKGDYGAIIEVPNGFTKQFFMSIFTEEEKPTFKVYLNDNKEITSTVVKSILDSYQYQFTLMTELATKDFINEDISLPTANFSSSIQTINQQEPVSTSAYYSFSMSMMFILYWAGTLAGQAFLEKHFHIFDRIILANINPSIYLLAIIVSTVILSMLQMFILFAYAHFMFDISYDPWPLYLIITFMIALVVGTIAALLSAINYRFNSIEASNIFGSSLVAILALLGGSFFNFSSFAPAIAKIGSWTPNGAALQGYLTIQQGGSFEQITPYIAILSILATICFIIAFLLFPRKGGIA